MARRIRSSFFLIFLGCWCGGMATTVAYLAVTQPLSDAISHLLWGGGLAACLGIAACWGLHRAFRQGILGLSFPNVYERSDRFERLWLPEELIDLARSWAERVARCQEDCGILKQVQHDFTTILENLADGVVIFNAKGQGTRWNRQALRLLRVPADFNLTQLSLTDRLRQPSARAWFERLLNGDPVGPLQLAFEAPEQHLELRAAAIAPDSSTASRYVLLIRDVTRMEVLDRVRRDFVANVSHELKTPLTTMKGFLETLLDGALEDTYQARHFTQIVLEQTDRLERIVDDLLTLTRLEGERDQPITRELVPVSDLVSGAVETCRLAAERRGMTLEEHVLTEATVSVNPRLFQMALGNLIDNAIKYSEPNKTIQIRVSRRDNEVVFEVVDQGWGIEARHLPRIFERFYRVDPGRSRALGGTGLGLAIVKHVAQIHGGYVTVESQVGRGSTFRIHIPG